jgi:hypothetical protein
MAKIPVENPPSMKGPAIYRIRVEGRLEAKWSRRLEAMNITEWERPDGGIESILVGRLADQTALAGVLNTLYELHLPVLSAECLEQG